MAFDNTPNRLESAFIQRDASNQYYEQVNVSGSDILIYHGPDGKLTADKISVWASNYGIGSSGADTSSWASSSIQSMFSTQSLFATESKRLVDNNAIVRLESKEWVMYDGNGNPVWQFGVSEESNAQSEVPLSASQFYGPLEGTSSWAVNVVNGNTNMPFDGDRPIKRNDPVWQGVNVGGTTVIDFLNNFFFPFVSATVAITGSSTTYYETGSVVNFVVPTVITANDEITFGSASVRRDGIIWNTAATVPPLSFPFTDSNISSSHTYITYVQTDNNGSPTIKSSNSKLASFIFPYLWGVSSTPGLSGNSLYTAFTRRVEASGSKTVSFTGNAVYIYFCYPSLPTYSELHSILDPNSFEAYGNFEHSASVPVTSSGLTNNWMTNYRVYRTKLVSDPAGAYTFR